MSAPHHPRLVAVDEGARVTPIELFFDLVFVFALTQVTALIAGDPTVLGLVRGLLVLGLLWWSWVAYAWLFNVVRADEGAVRMVLFAAMATMFVAALAIPEAFDDLPGGLPGPVVVALCYFAVRSLHLVLFWIIGRDDPGLRRQLLRFTPSVIGGTTLLLIASQFHGGAQTLLWALALLADYGGTLLGGASGWRLRSAGHFAERHGLILIVALGESIVAIGVGVAEQPVSWPIVSASTLGLAVAASLWWAYFDIVALVGERVLAATPDEHRPRLARNAYSYLHLPMVTGIVLLALGLKKVLAAVGDPEHHGLADPLTGFGLATLYGGVAVYLLGLVGFRMCTMRTVNRQRVAVVAALCALLPLAGRMPALAALGMLTAVTVGLVGYEALRFADVRQRIRHRDEVVVSERQPPDHPPG
ncbi:MAG: low temperature requirement protein A [Carbonactinosporaceae bacterium]